MVELTDQKQPLPRGAGDVVRYFARRLPPVVALRRWSYERHFANAAGEQRLFRGVYPDFATAIASAPAAHPIGYDNKASAHRLAEERHHVFPTDYPVLFWLAHLIGENTVLFDLGGNVGSRYLAFRNHLTYRDSLRWIVSEVPAVVELGREIAARENAPHLQFTTSFDELNGAHILLASGVLQFLEDWIGFLRAVPNRPPHVLINRTPVYAARSAVTLHSTGTAFCPYHLFNRTEFVAAFVDLGYRLVDEWANPGIGCYIPQHHASSIDAYSGFYFVHSGA
ncbi:MAG: methyltransferase, TIGR04325 family [Acetobacteraceae bacterium]|jgi:putative methyltransferase (TIGR04325 family)